MARKLTGPTQSAAQAFRVEDTTQQHTLGQRMTDGLGNEYVYVKAGGTALVPGKLQQAAAEVTNHQDLTPVAAAIGDTTVTVTLGATLATANQYAGGQLLITVTPGQGYSYQIKSHPAAASAGTLALTLEDPIEVALTTSSRCDLVPNPYNGVIVSPTTASSGVIGAAVDNITAASYGWLQTKGACALLADGAVTVGTSVVASNATAGAVEAATGAQQVVGFALSGIATTEYGAIFLTL
jgi:hypothetical protein